MASPVSKESQVMRTFLLRTLVASALIFPSACATTSRVPPFEASALAPYKNLALVQTNANELLFVSFRRYPQAAINGPLTRGSNAAAVGSGTIVTGNTVGASVANSVLVSVMGDAMYARWVRNAQAFNDALPSDAKSGMDQRLYSQLAARLTSRGIGVAPVTTEVDSTLLYHPEEKMIKKFAESVRKQCAGCDAALVVHAGYGFQHVPYVGMRAQAEADVLLIRLTDGLLHSRSTVAFTDTKNKYDYPYDTELLQDTVRAARWIPPTVDPLASLILPGG
jgi:hypothetical protein